MSAKSKNITLSSILGDKTSGSSELLSKLNKYFLRQVKNPSKIREEIPLVKNSLKDFAAVTNYLKKLETFLKKNDNKKLEKFLADFSQKENLAYDKISKRCITFLKDRNRIFTLSNSKTLFEVFTRLNEKIKNLEITVCESSPGKEGIIFGEKLSKTGIKTKIIPDSANSQFIRQTDCVVVGADSILKNGNVINKIGSLNAAIICKYYNIPFYVIVSKNKRTNRAKQDISFITHSLKGNKSFIPLFEEIDINLITKIFTD